MLQHHHATKVNILKYHTLLLVLTIIGERYWCKSGASRLYAFPTIRPEVSSSGPHRRAVAAGICVYDIYELRILFVDVFHHHTIRIERWKSRIECRYSEMFVG